MKKNDEIDRIGNIYGFTGGSFAGMVYVVSGRAPALNTMGGAGENLLSSSLHQHYRWMCLRHPDRIRTARLSQRNDKRWRILSSDGSIGNL